MASPRSPYQDRDWRATTANRQGVRWSALGCGERAVREPDDTEYQSVQRKHRNNGIRSQRRSRRRTAHPRRGAATETLPIRLAHRNRRHGLPLPQRGRHRRLLASAGGRRERGAGGRSGVRYRARGRAVPQRHRADRRRLLPHFAGRSAIAGSAATANSCATPRPAWLASIGCSALDGSNALSSSKHASARRGISIQTSGRGRRASGQA